MGPQEGGQDASTGNGYERHGRKFRVRITREDGSRDNVSFDTEAEAAEFVARNKSRRAFGALVEHAGVRGVARATRVAMERAFTDERETPTVAELGRGLVRRSRRTDGGWPCKY
jgi:hypothetical protein